MEESVWLYFGILAVIIAIGIIASIFMDYQADNDREILFASIQQMANQANLVCKSPRETMLSVAIRIPGGAILYTGGDKICARLDDAIKCVPTECNVGDVVLVNLTSEEARQLIDTHEYTCAFRNLGGLEVVCQG